MEETNKNPQEFRQRNKPALLEITKLHRDSGNDLRLDKHEVIQKRESTLSLLHLFIGQKISL